MRAAGVALAAAAVLLLAGCSSIPTSGSVHIGATEQANDPNIVYLANPPASGATQQDIVSGFILAANAGGDLKVAKEYLTKDFAASWQPQQQVLVHDQSPVMHSHGTASVTVRVPLTAEVDAAGVYTSRDQTVPLEFHLVQVAGQWRIDRAPDGIVLIDSVFQKHYSSTRLQFFDPSWKRLVPDRRWFPVPGTVSPARVVRAVAAGPSGMLADGVTVNALAGARVQSVVADPSGTVVSLQTTGTAPSAQVTTRMQQQLAASLGIQPSQLRLIVDGAFVQQAKALPAVLPTLQPFVLAGGRFGTLQSSNGQVAEDRVLGRRIAALSPDAVTVSDPQRLAAVRAGGAVSVVSSDGAPRVVDRRSDLVAPTLDQGGWTYSAPAEGTALRAFTAKGRSVDVSGDLGTGTLVSMEASPDGTRLLVVMKTSAYVAAITRDADGTPTGLAAPEQVSFGGGGTALGGTWVDGGSVAVLTTAQDSPTDRVTIQQLGGLSASYGQLVNAVAIVGTTTQDALRVRLGTGDLEVWRSNAWQSEFTQPVETSLLAVQR